MTEANDADHCGQIADVDQKRTFRALLDTQVLVPGRFVGFNRTWCWRQSARSSSADEVNATWRAKSMTVLELARAAVAETQDDPEGSQLTVAAVLRLLDVEGARNAHLQNPLNHPRRGHIRPREIPLSGTEAVHGAFLAFKYCAHDPHLQLIDFDDVGSLERMLASNAGIVNFYITYCIAFIDGQIARYRVAYRGENGSAGWFDKHIQNTQGPHPAERATNRWIVWDADAKPA